MIGTARRMCRVRTRSPPACCAAHPRCVEARELPWARRTGSPTQGGCLTRYHRSLVALGVVLAPLFLTREARASDWYVDAVAGDDAHAGTSPADSWKTITHALAALSSGSGPDTVHVAAGAYSVRSGEVFRLVVRDHLEIVGDGADATFFVAHAVGMTGFSIAADHEHNTAGVGSATALSGLTMQGFGVGVEVIA